MTSVTARNGFGTEVAFSGTTAAAMVGVAGLLSITPPKMSKNVIDITNHGTTDGYSQVIPGTLTRTSPITLTAVYITSSSMMSHTIITAYENRTKGRLQITIAGTSSMNQIISEGYVTDYGVTTPFDDKITFEMSFKPSGEPTFQAAT
jgi:predicted secreted protein